MMLLLAAWTAFAGIVEGRVVAPNGRPVPGAEVAIDALDLRDITDIDGRFQLHGVPAGRWSVAVRAAGTAEREVVIRVSEGGLVRLEVELPRVALDPAPDTTALSGVVRDGSTLAPVPYALVEVPGARRRTVAGPDGRFALVLDTGVWTVRASAPGYQPISRTIRMGAQDSGVDLLLDIRPLAVPGIEVAGTRTPARLGTTEIGAPSARVVDSAFVRLNPTAVERDVFRSIQALPSVTPASDYSSALFVRGGTPDQTRIMLDGTPVYNPFHLGGFTSAFSPEAVEQTVLIPGGLPASAPSSLAGVLEVRTRQPRSDSLRMAGGLGLLSSSVTVDGPLFGPTGFLVSARRTYVDVAASLAERLDMISEGIPYRFTDVLSKLQGSLPGGAKVTLSGYVDRERFLLDRDSVYEHTSATWGSRLLGLRGEIPVGSRTVYEGGVAASTFDLRLRERRTGVFDVPEPGELVVAVSHRTAVADAGVSLERGSHRVFAGARWERTELAHDFLSDRGHDTHLATFTLQGAFGSSAVWLRDRWSVGRRATIDLGVRAEAPLGRSWRILPRARVEKRLFDDTTIALAGGAYLQDWWSLRNEESAWASIVAYDVVAPVPRTRRLPRSWDATAELRTIVGAWDVRLDLFRKVLTDVPTTAPSADPLQGRFIHAPDSIRLGTGLVGGLEVSLSGRMEKMSVAAAYRWQSERRGLEGLRFVPRTDRRHRVVLSATRPVWGEREAALSVTWMSGIPVTPVRAVLPAVREVGPDGRLGHVASGDRMLFGRPNGRRLPSYLRIDLEARGEWDLTLFGRRGFIEPYLSVLNVLNQHNALVAEHRASASLLLRRTAPQLPILPSFGLRWRF